MFCLAYTGWLDTATQAAATPATGAFVAEEAADPAAFKRRLGAATVAALQTQVHSRA